MTEQPVQNNALIKKNRAIIFGVIATVILFGAAIIIIVSAPTTKSPSAASINSFQECPDAGYPVQQSFPEVCAVPNGKSFTNN